MSEPSTLLSNTGDSSTVGEKPLTPAQESCKLNPREQEFQNAKAFLSTQTHESGLSLYEHLIACLKRILEERPPNPADIFENVSSEVKKAKLKGETDFLQDKVDRATEIALAEIQRRLFQRAGGEEEEAIEEDVETPLPNLMQSVFLFEQAAVGLNREECYRVWLALKQLVDTYPLEKVRFWGKVLGTEQNYYIAEVEYREGEEVEEEQEEEEEPDEDKEEDKPDDDEEGDEEMEDKPPKSEWKPAPVAPKEEPRTGVNKKNYFVCNEPGKGWTRLPSTTPAHIVGARHMRKFFTGRLDAPVSTYPPYPGSEMHYLRAQIARISAGTQVSPVGFYQFDEEEEEEEEEGAIRENYIENVEFEGVPVRELADLSMAGWVHHVLHILPQGRTKWWNPVEKNEDEFEDEEDEEEEKEAGNEPIPETGPPLLTPLSEDLAVDGISPWTAKVSSNIIPQYAVAVLSSNLWPGAHAVASGKTFENVYIGWGHKYSTDNFSPVPPPQLMTEFATVPEITEVEDPTPEEEAALRAAQKQAEEGGEEGEEEAEEEEDD